MLPLIKNKYFFLFLKKNWNSLPDLLKKTAFLKCNHWLSMETIQSRCNKIAQGKQKDITVLISKCTVHCYDEWVCILKRQFLWRADQKAQVENTSGKCSSVAANIQYNALLVQNNVDVLKIYISVMVSQLKLQLVNKITSLLFH